MNLQRHIEIIYEDENFLAVNKPAGLLVHPVRSPATPAETERFHTSNGIHGINLKLKTRLWRGSPRAAKNLQLKTENVKQKMYEPTLVQWILEKYPEIKNVGDDTINRPGIVHRLDKDTSGILLIPKTHEYFLYLKSLFQRHEITKKYLAIVLGTITAPGIINKPISIKKNSMKRSVHAGKMPKSAVTEYVPQKNVFVNGAPCTLVEVTPKTGRTHQIRIHLASIGHPVLGDMLYGGRKRGRQFAGIVKRQMLHAESLEFNTRPGKRIVLSAPLPSDMATLLRG